MRGFYEQLPGRGRIQEVATGGQAPRRPKDPGGDPLPAAERAVKRRKLAALSKKAKDAKRARVLRSFAADLYDVAFKGDKYLRTSTCNCCRTKRALLRHIDEAFRKAGV